MPNRENLEKDIALATSIRALATAYEEIAVIRIQNIRRHVLAARAFREGLTDAYANVRASRYQEVARLQQKKQPIKTNVALLLSANQPLTGELPRALFEHFLTVIDRQPTDVAIVGRTGKESFTKTYPERPFAYFDLSYEHPTPRQLRPLVNHILQYHNITIVYGKFTNLVTQTPTSAHITSAPQALGKALPNERRELFFLFEPSLEEVVTFFEQQISAIVVRQTADEALLAQLGSQITSLEGASQRLTVHLKQLTFEHEKQWRRIRNQKQRQLLAGLQLWHTW